ncbi:MAG: hypothetical protein QOK36_1956 [Gaiellales bacterium]|nr:hypothetical protein [Gaiellales bacterium]
MAIAKHKSRRSELREGRVLARRVQRGDRTAFELLYAAYEGGLFRFAYRLTGSSERAATLVQATFSRALASLPEDGLDSLDVGAHLFATARGLSYRPRGNGHDSDHDVQASGNGHVNGSASGVTRRLAGGEHAREVVAASARLAPRQRMMLALRDLEGRPDDEIALALGTQRPVVPALVARARLRLREELALPTETAGCAGHLADLSAYADGTLPPEGRTALETHLEQCVDCRAALFALREAAQRYRAVPVPVPPGELSARMAAAVGAAGLPERRHVVPPAVAAPAAAPAPATASARAGRQTAAAIAMAALVLLGIVVTLLARDGDSTPPSRSSPPATKAAGDSHGTAATPQTREPAVAAGSGRRDASLAVLPKLRHARSGTRVFPHRSISVRPPRVRAPVTATPPARPASSEPQPLPAPPEKPKTTSTNA